MCTSSRTSFDACCFPVPMRTFRSTRSRPRSARPRRSTNRWSSRTCWRCPCERRGSNSSVLTCSSSWCFARARSDNWPSASAWSARTSIASCARSASTSRPCGLRRLVGAASAASVIGPESLPVVFPAGYAGQRRAVRPGARCRPAGSSGRVPRSPRSRVHESV